MLFSNWTVLCKSSFHQTICRVSHKVKKIEDIWLISQSVLPNLKSTSPMMMGVTVAYLSKETQQKCCKY